MNKQIIFDLFEKTSKFRQARKESLNELRDCYERYSDEYISESNFLKELNRLGFKSNINGDVKLKMKREIRKKYFAPGNSMENFKCKTLSPF